MTLYYVALPWLNWTLESAILHLTSASDQRIFSFALRGAWPCLHHARFTEPLQSCRRGQSAFVQTDHLPPFCSTGRLLEEEAWGKVKVKVGSVSAWVNIGCWPAGGLGGTMILAGWLGDDGSSTAALSECMFSHSLSIVAWAWTDCAASVVPTLSLGAVLRPSNSSSSEKNSVIYGRSDQIIKCLLIFCILTLLTIAVIREWPCMQYCSSARFSEKFSQWL